LFRRVVPLRYFVTDPAPSELYTLSLHDALPILGSNDAGGCLVGLIAAFRHFYHREDLPFNLCLIASAEEEISGKNGVELAYRHAPSCDFAIVGEPTLLDMAVAEKGRSEEHTSELQSREKLVCRLLLEKK